MSVLFNPGTGAISPLSTKGDIWTYTTQDARLAVGPNGQVLKADSSTPTGLAWGGGANAVVQSKSASYAVQTTDNLLLGSASGGAFGFTVPTAVGNTGMTFEFLKTDSTFNAISVISTSNQVLDPVSGATITTLNTAGEGFKLISDGTNYALLNRKTATQWATFTAGTTGMGAITNAEFRWRRDGADMLLDHKWTMGTRAANTVQVALPVGVTIATLAQGGLRGIVPRGQQGNSSNTPWGAYQSATNFIVFANQNAGAESFTACIGTAMNGADNSVVSVAIRVPIQGWNS